MKKDDLAVQSFCFRGFKEIPVLIERVKEIGLSRIELCDVHADFTDESGFAEIIETFRDADISIVSIGVQHFSNDEATEEKFFKFVKDAGGTTIGADFAADMVPESFRTAERLAGKYDINLGIHNHGGRDWLGSAQMLAAVFKQTSSRIGLMLDTAWALDSREDPLAMVDRFADRLYGLHVKDFVFDRARNPEDVVVGTGNLKLQELFVRLKDMNFAGNLILEYEGDVGNPVPALRECVEAIQREM